MEDTTEETLVEATEEEIKAAEEVTPVNQGTEGLA